MVSLWQARRDRRALALLAVLVVLAYLPVMLHMARGAWPFSDDSLTLFGMWREFSRRSLWHGVLPFWNPHLFCGLPLMLNGQATVLYPPTLLYWFLPLRLALVADAMFHNLLLAAGGYVFARALRLSRTASLLVALTLGFGGAVSGHINNGHLTWHAARAWLPWEWWALLGYLRSGRRRWILWLSICFGLQAASGYPPLALLSAALCLGLVLAWVCTRWRRGMVPLLPRGWEGGLVVLGVLAGGLSAVHMLPLLEISRMSSHSDMGYRAAVYVSGTWRTLARLLLPDFFGGNTDIQWSIVGAPHEEIAYIGLLPLLLALGAPWLCRRHGRPLPAAVPWLWFLMPVGAWLAMGGNGHGYHWLFTHSSVFRLLRTPVRWIELTYLAAALLSGFAFDAVVHRPATEDRSKPLLAALGLVSLFLLMLMLVLALPAGVPWRSMAATAQLAGEMRAAAIEATLTGLLIAVMSLAILASWRGPAGGRRRMEHALMVLMALDLLLSFWRGGKSMDAPYLAGSVVWPQSLVAARAPQDRWETAVPEAAINYGMVAGVDTFNGYDAIASRDYYQFAGAVEGRPFWLPMYQMHHRGDLMNAAAVSHGLIRGKPRWTYDVPVVAAGQVGEWSLVRYPSAWPRSYLTTRLVRARRPRQLRVLAQVMEVPGPAAVVAPRDFLNLHYLTASTAGTVQQGPQVSDNQIELTAVSPRPELMVQTDSLYPGWHATVNGVAAPIRPVNYIFRAVAIPAGSSNVRMAYEPESYRFGLFLSLAALGAVVGWALSGISKPRVTAIR